MSAHTPGPWKAVPNPMRDDGLFVVRGDAPPDYPGGLPPAVVPCQVPHADARLIAAAPDLLAAAEGLLKEYVDLVNCGDCGRWDPEACPSVIAARAAIAKATAP